MTSPTIRPLSPVDSIDGHKSIHGEYKFAVDDLESSIDIASLSTYSMYATQTLSSYEFSSKVTGNFRDTGANPNKSSSVDCVQLSNSSLELTVLQSDGDFNSSVFFPVDNKYTDGVGCSFTLDVPTHSSVGSNTPRPYYTRSDFTGISFGVFDFKTKKAVIVFLLDSQTLVVAGPASDGLGNRYTSADITYDWTTQTTFTISVDYRGGTVRVTCTEAEDGDDTVLYSDRLSLFTDCLGSVQLAGRYISENNDLIAFVSQDGRSIGDTVQVLDFAVYPYLYRLITNGSFGTNVTSGSKTDRSSLLYYDLLAHNFSSLLKSSATLYKSGEYDAIQFGSSAGFVRAIYADLKSNTFSLETTMYVTETSLAGISTGLGIDVMGSTQFSIRYLDGYIGLLKDNSLQGKRSLSGYHSYKLDPLAKNKFLFICDGATFRAYIYKTNTYVEMFSAQVTTLPQRTQESSYFVDIVSEAGLSGILYFKGYTLIPRIGPYIVNDRSTLLALTGTHTYTKQPPTLNNGTTTYTPATSTDSISGSYLRIPKYNQLSSGLTTSFTLSIHPQVPIQPEESIGPLIMLNVNMPSGNNVTHSLSMYITKGTDSNYYVYFPSDDNDGREVALRTNKGKYISFLASELELDLVVHYSPYTGVVVYNSTNEGAVLLEIPLNDIGGSTILLPDINNEGPFLPIDSSSDTHFTAAVGVLSPQSVSVSVTKFITGVGRGVDVSFYKSEKLPMESLYGKQARVITVVEDND